MKFKHKSQKVSFGKEQTVLLILLKQNLSSPEECPGSKGYLLAELGGQLSDREKQPAPPGSHKEEGGWHRCGQGGTEVRAPEETPPPACPGKELGPAHSDRERKQGWHDRPGPAHGMGSSAPGVGSSAPHQSNNISSSWESHACCKVRRDRD